MKDLQDLTAKLNEVLPRVKRYLPALFACLLLGIYGFLMYRINTLNNATPTVSTAQTAKVPKIDPKLIDQLKSLQDNSTSVQALFDEARNNPFEE